MESGEINENDSGRIILGQREKYLEELQQRWKCPIHSKDKETYCYNDGHICYVLTIQNMGYWALEIVRFLSMGFILSTNNNSLSDCQKYNGPCKAKQPLPSRSKATQSIGQWQWQWF